MKYARFLIIGVLLGIIAGHFMDQAEFHARNRACVTYETTKGQVAAFANDKIIQIAILEDCTTDIADKMFGKLP